MPPSPISMPARCSDDSTRMQVVAEYKVRFRQEAVLRVSSRACAGR